MCGHECKCNSLPYLVIALPLRRCCEKCNLCGKRIAGSLIDCHITVCHTVVKSIPRIQRNFSEHSNLHNRPAA